MSAIKTTCPKCKFEYRLELERDIVRTLPQNKLYWGAYLRIIGEHLGMYPDDLHEEMKRMFNAKDSKFTPGEKIGGTTTKLTTKEFTTYLENIKMWALTEHQVDLPDIE